MALADGAYLLEEFEDFVAFHGHQLAGRETAAADASAGSLMLERGSVKQARGGVMVGLSERSWVLGWHGFCKVQAHRQECLCHLDRGEIVRVDARGMLALD